MSGQLTEKKNTELLWKNNITEDGRAANDTVDLKRFNDIFSSHDNAMTSADGVKTEHKIGDVSGLSSHTPD
jgi:hypothetical protein